MKSLRYLENVVTLDYTESKCIGCGMCAIVCPHGVFRMSGRTAVLADRDACIECGACALNCPADAITVKSGVGCASGIITGLIRGTEPTCDCGGGSSCC